MESKVDIERLEQLAEERYITRHQHPTANLLIWNYTPRCQYERYWTPETMMCRGLITRPDGMVVARPFPKFFNIEEHQGDIPVEPFKVTAKMDGSLGILYFIDREPCIATRGSFASEQAMRATKILQERYADFRFLPQCTYLFEIIYPENRIVVDYGKMEDLILLTVIHTESGEEFDIHLQNIQWPFPIVQQYDGITDIAKLRELEETNKEGFVIHFASGLRLKAKFAEYVRLHRLLTQCTARTIWEFLRDEQTFDAFFDRVPDEFYAWVTNTRNHLIGQFKTIEYESKHMYEQVKMLPTRKEQAAVVTKTPYAAVVFRMLDGRTYSDLIWKTLKPLAEKPFREDEEG